MDLNELYSEMRLALESSVDAAKTDLLTTEATRFAGTVGWADGVIDKDGRIVEAFDSLRAEAQLRFAQSRDPNVAALHDALAKLLLAIVTHDEDVEPSPDNEDIEHDI